MFLQDFLIDKVKWRVYINTARPGDLKGVFG